MPGYKKQLKVFGNDAEIENYFLSFICQYMRSPAIDSASTEQELRCCQLLKKTGRPIEPYETCQDWSTEKARATRAHEKTLFSHYKKHGNLINEDHDVELDQAMKQFYKMSNQSAAVVMLKALCERDLSRQGIEDTIIKLEKFCKAQRCRNRRPALASSSAFRYVQSTPLVPRRTTGGARKVLQTSQALAFATAVGLTRGEIPRSKRCTVWLSRTAEFRPEENIQDISFEIQSNPLVSGVGTARDNRNAEAFYRPIRPLPSSTCRRRRDIRERTLI